MHPFTKKFRDSVAALGEEKLIACIRRWLGSASPRAPFGIGDDCAHFVSSCIGAPPGGGAGGLNIPSRAGTYGEPGAARLDELLVGNSSGGYGTTYQYGELVSSVNQLQPGDVIGYDWTGSGGGSMSGIDHTVIYLGNGLIAAHATAHDLGGDGDLDGGAGFTLGAWR